MTTRKVRVRDRAVLLGGLLLAAVCVGTDVAAAPAVAPADAQQRECERNGGYWVTASGHCKIGS
jgi:hypothetical protein